MGDDPIRPLPRASAEPKSRDPKLKDLSRQLAFRSGISAESRAAALLIAKGFRIVARRFKSPVGEIDIVARRRSLLIFVEVKARPDLEEAAWSVTELAFRTGISAESRAAALLIAKGFRIVARRFKSPVGEIDIVARRRSLLIFVEVKARPDLEEAAWSVTERQRARIIAAAGAWLARYPDERIRDIRFDAVLVAPGRIPRHITTAFDAGG